MNEFSSVSEHEEEDRSSENELSNDDDFLAVAVVAIATSRRNIRRDPQPMHKSRPTGSMRVEEIINGHEEIIQDLISMKSDIFKALSHLLGLNEIVLQYTLLKIVDYTTVIYRRVKFTRRLDNRRVIQRRGRYHDGSKIVVVSQYYTTVYTVVESRNIVANAAN
ncbi:hypothetical protein TIFTF001_027566 [Ficus carica]|uniref:Uncharacterized protein n=1 Tax=Ficus carica TaxID=3494 RepID=A0AA88DPG8_FICCA|nr:hypothetical protein TIFTF001_027566 [Ficus carica]